MVYKYPRARKFFDNLLSRHSVEEMPELLVVGVELPNFEMVKIEAEHPMPGLDNLLTG